LQDGAIRGASLTMPRIFLGRARLLTSPDPEKLPVRAIEEPMRALGQLGSRGRSPSLRQPGQRRQKICAAKPSVSFPLWGGHQDKNRWHFEGAPVDSALVKFNPLLLRCAFAVCALVLAPSLPGAADGLAKLPEVKLKLVAEGFVSPLNFIS